MEKSLTDVDEPHTEDPALMQRNFHFFASLDAKGDVETRKAVEAKLSEAVQKVLDEFGYTLKQAITIDPDCMPEYWDEPNDIPPMSYSGGGDGQL